MDAVERESFGPRLRGTRVRAGVTLDALARTTNVPVALWEALERGDMIGWPYGVLARAWITEYANLMGLPADDTLNEFCRLFPHGDRRRARIVMDLQALMAPPAVWVEDWQHEERRAPLKEHRSLEHARHRQQRLAHGCDLVLACVVALLFAAVVPRFGVSGPLTTALLIVTVGAVLFASPGARLIAFARQHRAIEALHAAPGRASDRTIS